MTSSNGNAAGSGNLQNPTADSGNHPTRRRSTTPVEVASDGGSSSLDGIVGFPTRRQALHVKVEEERKTEIEEKETRIRDLMAHRSLLLDRIRTCRELAEKRVGGSSSSQPSNSQGKELTDDEEIAAFREMTKKANAISKRSRTDGDGSTEKRTSLSLRRGSTVGKRMNAALSSLAPGSNAAAAGNTAAQTILEATSNNPLSSQTVTGNAPGSFITAPPKPGQNSTGDAGAGATSASLQFNHSTNNSSSNQMKISAPRTSSVPHNVHAPPSSLVRPRDTIPTHFSQHAGGGATTPTTAYPGPSRVSHPHVPRVYFPEAVTLREKRDRIRDRLRGVLERRQKAQIERTRQHLDTDIDGRGPLGSPSRSSQMHHSKFHRSKRFRKVTGMDINAPTTMPQRRRTHWDSVMEEMSWLASDFVQERKWKASTARLLSHQLPQHHLLKCHNNVHNHEADEESKAAISSESVPSDTTPEQPSEMVENNEEDRLSDNPTDSMVKTSGRYPKPSSNENELARQNGNVLSSMMTELNGAIQKGGANETMDKYHEEGRSNFLKARRGYMSNLGERSESNGIAHEAAEDMDTGETDGDQKENVDTHVNIGERIEQLHNLGKSQYQSDNRDFANALQNSKELNLTSSQKTIVEFVEKFWGLEGGAGAAISGPVTSGKTYATAAIIWSQKSRGPQLLLCPAKRVIRWKHELSKFSNLRAVTFGSSGGISNPSLECNIGSLKSGDVIICEYANLGRMKNSSVLEKAKLHSIVVDFRHPVSLYGPNARENLALAETGPMFPKELVSNDWWENLISCLQVNPRCLFIEYDCMNPMSLGKSSIGKKEQLVVLSKRAACIIGIDAFRSSSLSLQRQMLTWARNTGKSASIDKETRVTKALASTLAPMSLHTTEQSCSRSGFEWDLRICPMTPAQRREYEESCLEMRGTLSSCLESDEGKEMIARESAMAIIRSMFRLRTHCFHPRTLEILSRKVIGSDSGKAQPRSLMQRKQRNNPSQPDAQIADALLRESTKLRELALILANAGHAVASDESIQCNVDSLINVGKDGSVDRPRKVAVLAVLPEIRILVSVFLSAIGIRSRSLFESSNSTEAHPLRNEVTWLQGQLALSSFDSECVDSEDPSRVEADVVIASPCGFSFDEGLGLEGAEVVVVLDSDWSGRDIPLFDSLIRRWLARKTLADQESQLIRLVCEDTIETKLFLGNEHASKNCMWPKGVSGYLSIPKDEELALELYANAIRDTDYTSVFPALRLLGERGNLLSTVLSALKTMPPAFGSGQYLRFLPFAAPDDNEIRNNNTSVLRFLELLLHHESQASTRGLSFTMVRQSETSSTAQSSVASLEQVAVAGLASRQDLVSILPFLYLQDFWNFHSWFQLPTGNGPSILLSQLTNSSLTGFDGPEDSTMEGIDRKPSSLLLYDSRRDDSPSLGLSSTQADGLESVGSRDGQRRRLNAYAQLFSSSWEGIYARDGSQGTEPLVFFPPLFPLLEESAKLAKRDYLSLPSALLRDTNEETTAAAQQATSNELKRKISDATEISAGEAHETKRPKTQPETSLVLDAGIHSIERPSQAQGRADFKSSAENEFSAANPVSVRTEGAVVGDVVVDDWSFIAEDFGLIGVGALPRPVDAASFSAHDAVQTGGRHKPSDRFDFLSFPVASDPEDTNEFALNDIDYGMGSMLLYVKKSPGTNTEHPYGRQSLALQRPTDSLDSTSQFRALAINGEDYVKKAKKRSSQGLVHMPPTAFTRVQGGTGGFSNHIAPQTTTTLARKGDYREMILASYQGRQRTTGLSMFDSVSYRISAIRAERRVMERLERLMWKSTLTYDSGPGLPIHLRSESSSSSSSRRRWCNVATRMQPGTITGDAANVLALSQRASFNSSMVEPHRVDFGPFQVGFLASPSGMIAMSTGRKRVGVALPMGVKMMPTTREQRNPAAWTTLDDVSLKDSVMKFGENWLLVASVMSGFEHVVYRGHEYVHSVARSSRDCRDRWNLLLRSQPKASESARGETSSFRDKFPFSSQTSKERAPAKAGSVSTIASIRGGSIILKSSFLLKEDGAHESDKQAKMVDSGKIGTDKVGTQVAEDDAKKGESPTNDAAGEYAKDSTKNEGGAENDVEMKDTSSRVLDQEQTKLAPRRSFAAVKISKMRKHVVPVTIPGVVSGQPPNQPVPSHPSHIQAVQTSVTAQWANGRTEMWPLQILDLADKQRSSVRAPHRSNGSSPSSARRHHHQPSTATSHRGPPPRHHGHAAPFPAVPPNASRPAPQARAPPGSAVGSPPSQHHHPPSHSQHRNPAQTYPSPPGKSEKPPGASSKTEAAAKG